MDSRELARLDALAKAMVADRRIDAVVEYDPTTARLSVQLRSTAHPSAGGCNCSPMVGDYADLEEYVRRQVAECMAKMQD
jgi:hypothetical protein